MNTDIEAVEHEALMEIKRKWREHCFAGQPFTSSEWANLWSELDELVEASVTASEARGREEERATIIRNLPDLEDAIEEELYRWDMYPGSEKQAHAVVELISAALLPKEGTRDNN